MAAEGALWLAANPGIGVFGGKCWDLASGGEAFPGPPKKVKAHHRDGPLFIMLNYSILMK